MKSFLRSLSHSRGLHRLSFISIRTCLSVLLSWSPRSLHGSLRNSGPPNHGGLISSYVCFTCGPGTLCGSYFHPQEFCWGLVGCISSCCKPSLGLAASVLCLVFFSRGCAFITIALFLLFCVSLTSLFLICGRCGSLTSLQLAKLQHQFGRSCWSWAVCFLVIQTFSLPLIPHPFTSLHLPSPPSPPLPSLFFYSSLLFPCLLPSVQALVGLLLWVSDHDTFSCPFSLLSPYIVMLCITFINTYLKKYFNNILIYLFSMCMHVYVTVPVWRYASARAFHSRVFNGVTVGLGFKCFNIVISYSLLFVHT